MTWGRDIYGCDSGAVQNQLSNAQQIQASNMAFAAVLRNGSVVTWGSDQCNGGSGAVQSQLDSLQQIQASEITRKTHWKLCMSSDASRPGIMGDYAKHRRLNASRLRPVLDCETVPQPNPLSANPLLLKLQSGAEKRKGDNAGSFSKVTHAHHQP